MSSDFSYLTSGNKVNALWHLLSVPASCHVKAWLRLPDLPVRAAPHIKSEGPVLNVRGISRGISSLFLFSHGKKATLNTVTMYVSRACGESHD